MELNGQLHAPATLTLGRKPGTDCVEERVEPRDILDGLGEMKILPFPWFEPRSFQSVASRNAGYAARFHTEE